MPATASFLCDGEEQVGLVQSAAAARNREETRWMRERVITKGERSVKLGLHMQRLNTVLFLIPMLGITLWVCLGWIVFQLGRHKVRAPRGSSNVSKCSNQTLCLVARLRCAFLN